MEDIVICLVSPMAMKCQNHVMVRTGAKDQDLVQGWAIRGLWSTGGLQAILE